MAGNIKDILMNSFNEAVASVAEAGVKAGTEKARQMIGEVTGKQSTSQPAHVQQNKQLQSDSEDEVEYYEEDQGDSPNPFAAACFDSEKNLEVAAAYFRQFGIRIQDCELGEDGEYEPEPWIVASHESTGFAFAGSFKDFWEFSEHHGFDDDDWNMYGVSRSGDGTVAIDQKSIYEINISKDAVKSLSALLMSYDSKMDDQFRENHIDKDGSSSVTRMALSIPYLEGAPIAHFGIPIAIVYEAVKDGVRKPYIHEFGENSKVRPMLYTVGAPGEKKYVIIYGGDADVTRGWLIHNN